MPYKVPYKGPARMLRKIGPGIAKDCKLGIEKCEVERKKNKGKSVRS